MSQADEMKVARLRDKIWEVEDQLVKIESKLSQTIYKIQNLNLDSTGELQKVADDLRDEAIKLKAQLQGLDEALVLAEAKARE